MRNMSDMQVVGRTVRLKITLTYLILVKLEMFASWNGRVPDILNFFSLS